MAQQPPLGQSLLIIEASQLHSDTPHSVGLLWTSDQTDLTTHNTHNRQTTMPPTRFEPAILATEWPQYHSLDHASNELGYYYYYYYYYYY